MTVKRKKVNQMANPLKAQVDINLGGTDYKARLTIDAIMQIEEKLNCGILKLITRIADSDVRMTDLISVLTPALRGGGNDVSEKDVKKIVSDSGIINTTKVVAELLAQSLQVEDQEEDAKKKEDLN